MGHTALQIVASLPPQISRPANCGYAPNFGGTLDTLWSIDFQKIRKI